MVAGSLLCGEGGRLGDDLGSVGGPSAPAMSGPQKGMQQSKAAAERFAVTFYGVMGTFLIYTMLAAWVVL